MYASRIAYPSARPARYPARRSRATSTRQTVRSNSSGPRFKTDVAHFLTSPESLAYGSLVQGVARSTLRQIGLASHTKKRKAGVSVSENQMKLLGFHVQGFRSVDDSGWIETEDVTALVGVNESGKTNVIVPLWKLNPAREGEINPIADYPRVRYGEIRAMEEKPTFISAKFGVPAQLVEKLTELTGAPAEELSEVIVHRDFDGDYTLEFPNAAPPRSILSGEVKKVFSDASVDLKSLDASKQEEPMNEAMLAAVAGVVGEIQKSPEEISAERLAEIQASLKAVDISKSIQQSKLKPRWDQLGQTCRELHNRVTRRSPADFEEATDMVTDALPAFVYYSSYGNLDSEIYLPHVIENLKRTDLGLREEAKVRTLKVLFEFVKLSPTEILELGQDLPDQPPPTKEQIEAVAEKKKERSILLQSASTQLTRKFREWWKQGDYNFRFDADGDHFRIWVSDDQRPEEIELEGRSTGLQWFLSFFLVFLVESKDAHAGAILLLDEAGGSLHPLSQKDLSAFFDNLAKTNPLIYTTHSPFLIDADQLDRVKAVYVDDSGFTVVSDDLRAGNRGKSVTRSVYAVHAALGLSVSDTFLQGCRPIVVEGESDQRYLSAIKSYLIANGVITPARELVFLPAGGVKGIKAVVSIVSGKDEGLCPVVVDSDEAGRNLASSLAEGLYQGSPDKIIKMQEIVGLEDAEVEDLFPMSFMAKVITRFLPKPAGLEQEFEEVVREGEPIVRQVKAYAEKHGIELVIGWKVEVGKLAKARLLAGMKAGDPLQPHPETRAAWEKLFGSIGNDNE